MLISNVGSVCSGIEAASVAWGKYDIKFNWFSEIADFPSKVLASKYPDIPNIGDMGDLPSLILSRNLKAPDLICGGTPCQAFSLAGWKKGLEDERGNLTLKFVEIIEENDRVRTSQCLGNTVVFWENVEGVLSDKTNAFGCFIASLAGCNNEIKIQKWPQAGVFRGPKRNIAWRVLDAKFFGLPQQRRRLYVLAGGKDFLPENILFEKNDNTVQTPVVPKQLLFKKNGKEFEVFRWYTDCLYAAYGTKWNGNAAAYNGSLFIVEDKRLRRLTPLECERLMGFPDDYTKIPYAYPTARYHAIGNSWAVPVVRWIGDRLFNYQPASFLFKEDQFPIFSRIIPFEQESMFIDMSGDKIELENALIINCSATPNIINYGDISQIFDANADEKYFISPAGCYGIIRRKQERGLKILPRLEEVLVDISSQWTPENIEKVSRVQRRGKFSVPVNILF